MRAWMVILALGAGFSAVGQAAPISRCEYADGRVIYSDEACPAGSQRTRTVNEKPAVEVIKSATEKLAVSVHKFSKSAEEKIKKAGGSIEVKRFVRYQLGE